MGSFKAFLVTLNLIPNFSSCLDKTLTTVRELFKSSSNFSILWRKLTSNPFFPFSTHTRLHWRLRIQTPIKTPITSIVTPNGAALVPIPASSSFLEAATTVAAEDATAEERRQENSRKERRESKLESAVTCWDRRGNELALTVRELKRWAVSLRFGVVRWKGREVMMERESERL